MKRCFVTVGSTQFEELIARFFQRDMLQALHEIEINNVVIQNGRGKIFSNLKPISENLWEAEIEGIKFSLFCYRDSIRSEMELADLVVGHAGAGTCMEVLELNKPFIAVMNHLLMDDHQSELAERLEMDGYLLCTVPEKLTETLKNPDLFNLAPFPKTDQKIFLQFMENFLMNYL